jgi:hypothetical protein
MIRPSPWPAEHQSWDQYRAFHIAAGRGGFGRLASYHPSPLVLFDTGELILTKRQPDPNERGEYRCVGVELTRSDEMGGYWTPTGLQVKKAWFHTSQWALVDEQTGRAVRVDRPVHGGPGGSIIKRPNVPERFKTAQAYIGGPGCHPVGSSSFEIRPTVRDMHPAAQEHAKRIEQTFRAAMILTEDPITSDTTTGQALPFERVMALKGWEELDDFERRRLWRNGIDRPKLEFDYLLTDMPK